MADGWTYFVQQVDDLRAPIKIGRTLNAPTARLRALQSGSPVRLGILLAIEGVDLEAHFHHEFSDYRLHGEWFEAALPVVEFVHIERQLRARGESLLA